jgi:repressor LexA
VFFIHLPVKAETMKKLSEKQRHIVKYIYNFLSKKGYPPSIRDIQKGCNISSTSVVDYNLNILESRGIISRHAEISRGIRLLSKSPSENISTIPVIGMIAAGEPIPVPTPDTWDVAAVSETMDIPSDLVKGREDVYALRVKGTSMVDALINDGDIVLMQHVSAVENGQMAAVWLKSEKEVTLKKVYVEKDRVRLQPANSQMREFFTEPDNIEIQGKVIGVVRRLS